MGWTDLTHDGNMVTLCWYDAGAGEHLAHHVKDAGCKACYSRIDFAFHVSHLVSHVAQVSHNFPIVAAGVTAGNQVPSMWCRG